MYHHQGKFVIAHVLTFIIFNLPADNAVAENAGFPLTFYNKINSQANENTKLFTHFQSYKDLKKIFKTY